MLDCMESREEDGFQSRQHCKRQLRVQTNITWNCRASDGKIHTASNVRKCASNCRSTGLIRKALLQTGSTNRESVHVTALKRKWLVRRIRKATPPTSNLSSQHPPCKYNPEFPGQRRPSARYCREDLRVQTNTTYICRASDCQIPSQIHSTVTALKNKSRGTPHVRTGV